MSAAVPAVEAALRELERLRTVLKKSKAPQVRSSDETALAKATASAWFTTHRSAVLAQSSGLPTDRVDDGYREILESSDRHGSRTRYIATLKLLKAELISLRTLCMSAVGPAPSTSDQVPDFSPLIADIAMQQILTSRWNECLLCLKAGAALAATVMMGGLLEALLLARINSKKDKSPLFLAKAAPRDHKGNTKKLNEWMLNDFIQVLSELKWITVSASAAGAVLMNYRNYVHPQKQLSHNMHLTPEDAALFWEVTKQISRQVIKATP